MYKEKELNFEFFFLKYINIYKGEGNMEENLHSINSMRNMDVVDIKTGKKLGYISDIKLDCEEDKVLALIVPGESKGWFGKTEDIEIPWENVEKIGVDVILVSAENVNIYSEDNNIYR